MTWSETCDRIEKLGKAYAKPREKSVSLTVRVHPFPFRTRKLSSQVPKILGWRRPGKIGRC